jgi:LCP family protein required for cell wall assembly
MTLRGVKRAIKSQDWWEKRIQHSSHNTALLARRVPIDMSLPGVESIEPSREFTKKAKWHKARKLTSVGLALSIVLVLTFGGLIFSENYIKLHKVFRATASADSLSKTKLLSGQSSGRINVLLLGRDGGRSVQPDITNTIILASIDVVNNNITFISVPGTIWVKNNSGVMYLNQAFEKGENQYLGGGAIGTTNSKAIEAGFQLADSSVSNILGTAINYNVIINFQAVQQLVNTLGGITLNVPTALSDPTMAWQNKGNPVLAPAGTDTLNGNQALLYLMSKATTSESSREQRQAQILKAVFKKIMSSSTLINPLKISQIISTLGNNLASDLSMTQAIKLYQLVTPINSNSINSLSLLSSGQYLTTGNMVGQPILLPVSGLFNYSSIHSYIATQLPNPYLVKENAGILILNSTTTPGLATALGNKLSSKGFNVIGVANTPTTGGFKYTTLYNITGGNSHTQGFLEKDLKVKLSNKKLNKTISPDGANFVIIIGNNEANNS